VADDLEEGADDQRGYHSLMHGPIPLRLKVKDFVDECDRIKQILVKDKPDDGLGATCIVARTRAYCDQIASYLENAGVAVQRLDANPDSDEGIGVRIATMHRVKGLEFDRVIVSGIAPDVYPILPPETLDVVAQERWKERERALLYVAMTRARKEVVLLERS
jgi:superfamily I DNA/RNA helicase